MWLFTLHDRAPDATTCTDAPHGPILNHIYGEAPVALRKSAAG